MKIFCFAGGWLTFHDYRFYIKHQPSNNLIQVKLWDNGTLIIDTGAIHDNSPKALKGGKIGVFEFSSSSTKWSALNYRCLQPFSNITSATTTTTTTTTSAQTTSTQKVCQFGWSYYSRTTKCYKVFRTSLNWAIARAECQKSNAELASIVNHDENAFISNLAGASSAGIWIGGLKLVGRWTWSDGTAWSYTNWSPGEPNNHRGNEISVHLHISGSGQWNDAAPEGTLSGFVCAYYL